jgi:hypothetical protein
MLRVQSCYNLLNYDKVLGKVLVWISSVDSQSMRVKLYSHFFAISHPFSAAEITQLFLDNVYKLHGLPQSIESDRDAVFTSMF